MGFSLVFLWPFRRAVSISHPAKHLAGDRIWRPRVVVMLPSPDGARVRVEYVAELRGRKAQLVPGLFELLRGQPNIPMEFRTTIVPTITAKNAVWTVRTD